jgi:dienelactone hydrolase
MFRVVFVALLGMVTASVTSARCAAAEQIVTFPSAHYLVGDLQQRLARERGEPLKRAPDEMINGYLLRPDGDGPFPAVVHLHGCGGLLDNRRIADGKQFTNWGYVTLMVDSFATRGIKEACAARPIPSRQADAMGALIYLSKLPFVDPTRIAVVGYSQGGSAALNVASVQPAGLFEMPAGLKYKAAVAYYPSCSAADDEFAIPTLVFIGELDDWSLAAECRRMMNRQDGKGALVKLVVFPEAFHSFDSPSAGYGVRYFGHWLRYNADATKRAAAQMRRFLKVELAN